MRAVEAFWSGRWDAFRTSVAKSAPKCVMAPIWQAMNDGRVKDPGSRDGVAYAKRIVEVARPFTRIMEAWEMNERVELVVEEATDRAVTAMGRLDEAVKKFRGETKNDLASMKAVSDRVQAECDLMADRYRRAAAILTTPEFMQAVENAERLVVALDAIQKLHPMRLAVSVFEADVVAPSDASATPEG